MECLTEESVFLIQKEWKGGAIWLYKTNTL